MAFAKLTVLFLLVALPNSVLGDSFQCPWNPTDCECSTFGKQPEGYALSATCETKDQSLPKFTPNPNVNYIIDFDLNIKGDVSVIPANHFEAFTKIGSVRLEHTKDGGQLRIDDHAFDGIKVTPTSFSTENIDGLIPTQPALKVANPSGLAVIRNPKPVVLSEKSLENVPNLAYLNIWESPIESVHEKVFSNLKNFGSFSVQNTDISKILPSLSRALTNQGMRVLNLFNAGITELKKDTLPSTRIYQLYLSANPITKIENGAFQSIKDLINVDISNNKLEKVDLAMFSGIDTKTTMKISLDQSRYVKDLTWTITQDKMPYGEISIYNTTVENIDESIKTLLDKTPSLKLHLGNSNMLKCEGLKWMTQVDCPERIYIGYSKCADRDQYLFQYLEELDPNTNCRS